MDINKFSVVITDVAERDMEDIYEYIETKLLADKSAKKLVSEIKQKILELENNPYMYPEVYTKPNHELYHKLTVKKYVVLYQVDENSRNVVIYKVEYGMKDYLYFE